MHLSKSASIVAPVRGPREGAAESARVEKARKSKDEKKECGADRDRTDDIQLAKLALSQLSYSPTKGGTGTLTAPAAAHGARAWVWA